MKSTPPPCNRGWRTTVSMLVFHTEGNSFPGELLASYSVLFRTVNSAPVAARLLRPVMKLAKSCCRMRVPPPANTLLMARSLFCTRAAELNWASNWLRAASTPNRGSVSVMAGSWTVRIVRGDRRIWPPRSRITSDRASAISIDCWSERSQYSGSRSSAIEMGCTVAAKLYGS